MKHKSILVNNRMDTIEVKYKVATISDRDLASGLDNEHKLGFEVIDILEKVLPNASSDFVGWRVLLRKN